MTINMLGIDIAKNTFQLHGADISGKAVHKKRLARRELAAHVANLPACTIVMEACGGANYWARVFQGSLEYGVVLIPGAARVKASLCVAIAEGDNELTPSSRESLQGLYEELVDVESRLKNLNTKIRQLCRQNEKCQRILKIPGVGELTATAIVAAVPNPGEFRNGRHMSAWLGLVPRQSSSGDKQILLGISKRGD